MALSVLKFILNNANLFINLKHQSYRILLEKGPGASFCFSQVQQAPVFLTSCKGSFAAGLSSQPFYRSVWALSCSAVGPTACFFVVTRDDLTDRLMWSYDDYCDN